MSIFISDEDIQNLCLQTRIVMARNLTSVDQEKIFGIFSKDIDALVRFAIAQNYFTPMELLRELLKDTDAIVRLAAERTLKVKEEEIEQE